MTAVDSGVTAGRRTEVRWRGRTAAALLLPVGASAVAALRFVLPYQTTDDSTDVVREVAAHQTAQSAVVWLGFIASLTLVPAVFAAAKVARSGAPRLTFAALALLVPGYLSLAWLAASDAALLFCVQQGVPNDVAAESYESLHPVVLVAGVFFVVGHVLGTVLLGIAFWRGRTIHPVAALAVLISQPLHFVAAVIVGSHWLDLFAWGLNAAGFAVVATVVLKMSDEDWAAA